MRRARAILAHSLAESTRAGYKSAIASIAAFCAKQKLHLSFPVSPDTLCLWMASAASTLTYGTIRVYLHGVGTTHVELGCANPLEARIVWRMFTAVKRLQGAQASKQKLPITAELLLQLERWQTVSTVPGLALRAAMWLGTCGLLRSGEFAIRNRSSNRLLRRHLEFLDAEMQPLTGSSSWQRAACMRVHIAASKTDPFKQGADVLVSNAHAISAMAEYLQARGNTLPDAPLFCNERAGPLEVGQLIKHMQMLLQQAGVADARRYAGHSFRRGGATSLHLAGVADSLIRVMGRWKSFAFARYIDVPFSRIIAAGLQMATASSKGKNRTVTFALEHKTPQSIWE